MAGYKVNEKSCFWVVLWAGDGRPSKDLKSFPTFKDAHNFCEYHDWVWVDKSGVKWNMDIDEREPSLDDVIKTCEKVSENSCNRETSKDINKGR